MAADLRSTNAHIPESALIIFLDEPTAGLDPRSRRTMWNIVRELVADGVTVFLTTQNLEEADQLADRIAVLDQGHLVAEGTPDALKRQVPGSHVRLRFTDVLELDAARPGQGGEPMFGDEFADRGDISVLADEAG